MAQGRPISPLNLARLIDATLVKPDATKSQILRFCREARKLQVAAACVNPYYVAMTARLLRRSEVRVCCAISFPFGAETKTQKILATRQALSDGAKEIDVVMNIGAFKSGNYRYVRQELDELVTTARKNGSRATKIIIETAYLSRKEKIRAAKIVAESGAEFVKTSTGYSTIGATISDVKLLYDTVGERIGIKAAGGIRTFNQAMRMVMAGATRIGTSSAECVLNKGNL